MWGARAFYKYGAKWKTPKEAPCPCAFSVQFATRSRLRAGSPILLCMVTATTRVVFNTDFLRVSQGLVHAISPFELFICHEGNQSGQGGAPMRKPER